MAEQHGGKRTGAGRPPGTTGNYKPETEHKKNRSIKFTDHEWETIQAKARSAGSTASEYIRKKILEETE